MSIFCSGEDDLIPQGMSNDCIAQSWYRFLNTVGNPVSLTKPEVSEIFYMFLNNDIINLLCVL